jgi:Cytochrome c554 and c-prime
LRQFDAECIVCHTVGFGYETGYKTEKDTPHLKNVGCESCHGPASEHVKKPNDAAWYPILNPWRPPQNETREQKKQRMLRIDRVCQECHDVDNDVKYKFEKRWPEIAHPSPGNEDR